MTFDGLSVDEIAVDELQVKELSVEELFAEDLSVDEGSDSFLISDSLSANIPVPFDIRPPPKFISNPVPFAQHLSLCASVPQHHLLSAWHCQICTAPPSFSVYNQLLPT